MWKNIFFSDLFRVLSCWNDDFLTQFSIKFIMTKPKKKVLENKN
jgi:hypothetical protein